MTVMADRRALAQQEAVALRLLLRAHGRYPTVAPLRDWDLSWLRPHELLPDAGERNGKAAA